MILAESSFLQTLFNAHELIMVGGLLLLLAIIYVETGFFLGFVLPGGDYLLFAAGIFWIAVPRYPFGMAYFVHDRCLLPGRSHRLF